MRRFNVYVYITAGGVDYRVATTTTRRQGDIWLGYIHASSRHEAIAILKNQLTSAARQIVKSE